MVSADTLISYTDCKLPFKVHTYAYDKQLGAVISHDNKLIDILSRRSNKPQHACTTTEKGIISTVECLEQFRGIIFGYEIKIFSDHKNLVYATTLSESKRVMRW